MLVRRFDGKVSSDGLAKLDKLAHLRRIEAHFIDAASRRHWQDRPELARWIVLAVDGRKAGAVFDSLEKADVEALLPMEKRVVVHSRTKEKMMREKPLMPGYMLARCIVGPAAVMGVTAIEGVRHVLHMADGAPYTVSNDVIIRFSALSEIVDKIDEDDFDVMAGDFVEIMRGPFEGIRAHVRRIDRRKKLAVIKATMFAGALDIPIPLAFVEKL